MKKILSIILSLVMIISVIGAMAAPSVLADDYTLVWSDEFDGAGVNPWNWTLDQGGRNGERQTYTLNNVSVHDGMLDILGECTVVDKNGNVMPAGQVSKETRDVRSASIEGSGKQVFKYGMVEVRAKLPTACSSWPAFWTCGWDKYGKDPNRGGSNWPACGEIDFMEMMCVNSANETESPWGKKNKDKEYEVHLHCGPKSDAGEFHDMPIDPGNIYNTKSQPLGYEWHTYGMIWEENQIQFTMDGVVRITVDTSDEALLKKAEQKCGGTNNEWYQMYKTQLETEGNPFNDFEHYFLLNYAIGGAGTEYRFYSDEWPQHLLIDYIRVYQKPNSGATHNKTLFDSYNYWYGKGLSDGADMAQNWIDDPIYGGKKTEDSGVTVGTTTATVTTTSSGQVVTNTTASGSSSTIKLADLGNNVQIHTDLQQSALNDKTEKILQYARGAEELSHPKAITLSWTSSVSGTYTVKIGENSNLSDAKTYTTTSKSLSLYNLKIGTKYYWQVSCGSSVSSTSSFTTSSSAPRNLYISKVTNCRDIGGWSTGSGSVKQGLLYRTAKLDSISDTGKSTMLDDLGIKTEIDLRETTEKGVGSSALGSSVKYCNVPMVNGGNRLTGNKEKVKDVFKILADKNNYPIVFHCSAGADRTGLIAFLINGLLGVSESDLVRDFSFTNFGNIGGSRGHDALNDYLPKIKKASGSTLAEQMYNYLVNDTGVSASYLDSVISILSGNTVMPTVTTSKTTTTTTPTTANGGSTGGTTASSIVIDWDVNTNYWDENSTLTKGTNCITATKSSGAKLITSNNNNIAAYDGLKFTVTPNSANQKTALVVKVNGVQKNFTLGSGTTECVLSFAEIGVTPTSSSTIFFGAEGDG
ncbi:MAG: tyrosine-protein phosphatase, partial [Clostridia bacterium]|nr:tyrosine-protein phosphatase [Clostridia bacterium]